MSDATLDELTSALNRRAHLKASRSAVVRAMARLGFTRKNSRWSRSSEIRRSTERDARSIAHSSWR
jgi:hypothetical protein